MVEKGARRKSYHGPNVTGGAMVVLVLVLVVILVLLVVCVARAAAMKPTLPAGSPIDAGGYHAGDAEVERFRTLLRIPTVSRDDPAKLDREPFDCWVPTLQRLYPCTFQAFELTRIDEYGILMRWPGHDSSLAPVVMMAHHDVVPTDGQEWTYPPFAAEVHDGQIWARGALDNKLCFCGCMEAFEHLLAGGYVPPRDIWFFSSCCEETSGPTADNAVAWLREHNVHPCMVLDEGGAVATGVPLGVTSPMAMVGVSEKGHVDVTVTAHGTGGHASAPSNNDATRLLARATERICGHPGKPQVADAVMAMLQELAARGSFAYRIIFANMWLFRPLVGRILAAGAETGPMVRSTYALTQLQGSPARNVLPPEATANLNVRVAPFEDVSAALSRARAQAAEECRASGVSADAVSVEIAENSLVNEPSPFSPHDDAQFDYIRRCVAGVYPEAGVCPYVQTSCSDSRSFTKICDHVYRFAAFIYTPTARGLIHGANERIPVDDYKRGVEFYVAFVRGLDQLKA